MRDWTVDGEAVRARRLALRMTQRTFARECGLALSFIKLVEQGRSQPGDVNGLLLTDVLECDISDIAVRKEPASSSGSAA